MRPVEGLDEGLIPLAQCGFVGGAALEYPEDGRRRRPRIGVDLRQRDHRDVVRQLRKARLLERRVVDHDYDGLQSVEGVVVEARTQGDLTVVPEVAGARDLGRCRKWALSPDAHERIARVRIDRQADVPSPDRTAGVLKHPQRPPSLVGTAAARVEIQRPRLDQITRCLVGVCAEHDQDIGIAAGGADAHAKTVGPVKNAVHHGSGRGGLQSGGADAQRAGPGGQLPALNGGAYGGHEGLGARLERPAGHHDIFELGSGQSAELSAMRIERALVLPRARAEPAAVPKLVTYSYRHSMVPDPPAAAPLAQSASSRSHKRLVVSGEAEAASHPQPQFASRPIADVAVASDALF